MSQFAASRGIRTFPARTNPMPRPALIASSTASPWEPADKRAQQRELKRNAVLQTAAQLFNERGFHATSLDDIAERLNVSKPTVYYYVESKDQILLECVKIALDLMQAGIDEVRAAGGSAIDQLKACMRIYSSVVTQDFGMCVIRIGEDPLPDPLKRSCAASRPVSTGSFAGSSRKAWPRGSLAPCDPKMAAFMLAGALSWIGRWYRPDGDLTPDQIADQGIELLLNGVLHRPAAGARRKPAAVKAR